MLFSIDFMSSADIFFCSGGMGSFGLSSNAARALVLRCTAAGLAAAGCAITGLAAELKGAMDADKHRAAAGTRMTKMEVGTCPTDVDQFFTHSTQCIRKQVKHAKFAVMSGVLATVCEHVSVGAA
jgi:hypothetical protein